MLDTFLLIGVVAFLYFYNQVRQDKLRRAKDGITLQVEDVEYIHLTFTGDDYGNDFVLNSLDWNAAETKLNALNFEITYIPHKMNCKKIYWIYGKKVRADFVTQMNYSS